MVTSAKTIVLQQDEGSGSVPGPSAVRSVATPKTILSFLKLIFVVSPGVTLLVTVATSGFNALLRHFGISLIIATVTASVCFWGVHGIRSLERMVRQKVHRPRVGEVKNLSNYLLAIALMPAGLYFGFSVLAVIGPHLGWTVGTPGVASYRIGIFMGIAAAALFFLVETQRESRLALIEKEKRLKEEENAKLKAQVSALTAQMNPHFLFNSLNTIASLVAEAPAVAEEMTVKLAEVYRSLLSASKQPTQRLKDELDLCRAYLSVERIRFGDRLRTSIDVAEDLDLTEIETPSLIIQPLVENALKYAVAPRSKGGHVAIKLRRVNDSVEILVQDDGPGPGRSEVRPGTGSSLENCRERLEMHFGPASSLTLTPRKQETGTNALIRFPIRSPDSEEKAE